MGYTIREITSGWSVIDYPEYFRDLDRAIYNAKGGLKQVASQCSSSLTIATM